MSHFVVIYVNIRQNYITQLTKCHILTNYMQKYAKYLCV